MPKIFRDKNNYIKKLSLIFLSFMFFLGSMNIPLIASAQGKNLEGIGSGSGSSSASDSSTSTWYNQGFIDWYSKVYGSDSPPSEIFGERYTAAQVQWILYSLFAFPINILGGAVQDVTACIIISPGISISELVCYSNALSLIDELSSAFGIARGTAEVTKQPNLGFIHGVVKDYQQRPLSGIKYVTSTVSKYSLITEVQAQGFGYGAVKGLQDYWRGFRDIAYALSVLVTIIFSFMIMFRVKLSPQLVISVQSALPKVFGALILATFSYAIAGFVIDFSYVIGGLLAALMNLAKLQDFQTAFNLITPINNTATQLGPFYIFSFMARYSILFLVAAVMAIYGAIFAVGGIGSTIAGVIMGLLAMLTVIWILILMFWYTIKVPIVLIKNLVSLFISIVVSPIQIVMGSLVPSIGFGVWFKKIIAEALVFPVTGLFMFLAIKTLLMSIDASLGQNRLGTNSPELWSPPILGSADKLGGIIWLAVSFTFITMIPKAVDILKMLIMGAKFDFGTAMGEATAVGQTVGLGAANYRSSREASDWQKIQNDIQRNGGNVDRKDQLRHDFMNLIRGVSAGKVK